MAPRSVKIDCHKKVKRKYFFNGLLVNSEYQKKKNLHFIFFAKTNILKGEFQTLLFLRNSLQRNDFCQSPITCPCLVL